MHFSKCRRQMLPQREIILTALSLIVVLAEITGEETRLSRSINDRSPFQNYPVNFPLNLPVNTAYSSESRNDNRLWTTANSSGEDRRREFEEIREEKLFRAIVSKDYRSSSRSDIEQFERIGERMIERANLTEDAKRVVRQVKKQRPGFFWTLARVAFETVNETRSAIEQINVLISSNFAPETTTMNIGRSKSKFMENVTTEATTIASSNATTTEEPPFRLTPSELQRLVRRNFQGLIRLFNLEWREALNQSQSNVRDFQRDLGNKISPFLQDNPDVV